MRAGSTGPVKYLTDQSRKVTGQTCLGMYLGRMVGPWCLVLLPGCRALCFFLPASYAALLYGARDVVLSGFFTGVVSSIIMWCARKMKGESNPRMGN